MKLIFFISLFLVFFFRQGYAGEENTFNVKKITIEDGLSQNTVFCMHQDRTGYLWFGTKDGLNKFDGYTFTIYRNDPADTASLSNNRIECLLEDKEGFLWVGTTGGGLNRFDPLSQTFRRFIREPGNDSSLSHNIVKSLFEDAEGYLWIGTTEGLNKFNRERETFTRYLPIPSDTLSLSDDYITAIAQDPQNKNLLWVGTQAGGLNLLDKMAGRCTRIKLFSPEEPGKSLSFIVTEILTDVNGDVYVSTNIGLLIIHNYTLKRILFQGLMVHTLLLEPRGRLWLVGALQHKSPVLFQPKTETLHPMNFLTQPAQQSLSIGTLISICIDKSGIVWLGTDGTGILKCSASGNRFRTVYTSLQDSTVLSSTSIRAICEERNGKFWIGGYGGLDLLDPVTENITPIPLGKKGKFGAQRMEINNRSIYVLCRDKLRDSILWAGTEGGGLYEVNISTGSSRLFVNGTTPLPNSLFGMQVFAIIDDDSLLWIGTDRGLDKFSKSERTFQHFINNPPGSMPVGKGKVVSLYKHKNGNLWIGTDQGSVSLFHTGNSTVERYSDKIFPGRGTMTVNIYSLYEDNSGTLWIGTGGWGLVRFNLSESSGKLYTTKDGLPNNVVYGILEDTKGNLWLSTNRGLSKFDPRTETVKNYDESDGLQSNEFNGAAYFKSSRGIMFFGGIKGVTWFDPDSLGENSYIPPIVITSFQKFNKSLRLLPDEWKRRTLSLSHDDNVFGFEFSALDYTEPMKNKYEYKMEGFDPAWVTTTSERRMATYTNLDPGEYIFKVRGSNNDGKWNEQGASLRIIILPPYWETWWFRMTLAVVLGAIFYGLYRARVGSLRKQHALQERFAHQLIESQEQERKRIAVEMHDAISQDVLIMKNLSTAALELSTAGQKDSYLQEIADTASQTIEDVRKISRALRPYQIDRLGLTKALESIFSSFAKSPSIHFDYHIDELDGIFSKQYEMHIYRIIQESINNIIKHSQAHEAVITVEKNADAIAIIIKDDGKGFSEEISKEASKQRFGFGLSGISERVNILNGKLDISSKPGKGTCLTIVLPYSTHI
ncbi:MAG: hypothetical protein EPO24_11190 [Bacteroidetes bacterium]|nr:MAG: hypothetical protein EPO24_11190 [Bacteroidota bacterium]